MEMGVHKRRRKESSLSFNLPAGLGLEIGFHSRDPVLLNAHIYSGPAVW